MHPSFLTSAGRIEIVRWILIPECRLGEVPRVVTSGSPAASHGTKRQTAAADEWLSTAFGPHALIAATHRAIGVRFACPTANTPR